ncbi:MAG: MbnP family protein [Bacteroidota bacterium]
MKRSLLYITLMLMIYSMMGQKGAPSMKLVPIFAGETLRLDHAYAYRGDSVVLSKLRFYLSDIRLLVEGEEVWAEQESYHLIDLAEPNSLLIPLQEEISFDEVHFKLGIDSLTNVSGAMGGDLDPTKGMYWSWNTGYINFKLEGQSPLAGSRNQRFIYHLGGYLPPYPSVQKIQLKCEASSQILVGLDIEQFLQAVDLEENPNLMSPGQQCAQLAEHAASLFKILGDE